MKSAVTRFRVMAIICGVMSLLLWFVYMPGKYASNLVDDHKILIFIPIVHGYLYMLYILTALQLSVQKGKSIFEMAWLILAGTLPVASLVAERKIVKQYP
jgi:integral membrane protein